MNTRHVSELSSTPNFEAWFTFAGRTSAAHTNLVRGFWIVCALAVLAATCALTIAAHTDDTLAEGIIRHLQRTGVASAAALASPSLNAPGEALTKRYLGALPPEVRRRIGDRVREEQRVGAMTQGSTAFVLRRLELYEAELQRSRSGAVRY